MTTRDWLQILALFGIWGVVSPWLGEFMHRIFSGEHSWPSGVLAPVERAIYRAAGVDPRQEMSWSTYLGALLVFNAIGFGFLLLLLLAQGHLPLNPQKVAGFPFSLALNTAVSFVTNTDWQAYSGEAALSYLSQILGLTVQNFLSAATGLAVAIALMRGLTRKSVATVGNFWSDLVRGILYVLLPLSLILAVALLAQGVPQTFSPFVPMKSVEGADQLIPLGPVASQVAIKQVGTNGGGYFGANAAHPFENPTPLSNFLQMLTIFLIPAALTFTYGRMAKDLKQGWTIFGAMSALFVAGFLVSWWAESHANPVSGLASAMEGKEVRFGVMNSTLFATITTAASCGAVNAMHDSLSPISGGVALLNMLVGEVVFGGVGAGLYGMLIFVILTVFLAGLMVGRTPELLGKKIEAREVRWAVIAALAPCVCILLGVAVTCAVPASAASLGNAGPRGFTEILYAFTSAAANNGSAYAGLAVNTDFYNYALAAGMFLGRFAIIVPVLAIAGSMAAKKVAPPSPGTFSTVGFNFAALLIAVVLVVGALTFFPAFALGPVTEQALLQAGRAF